MTEEQEWALDIHSSESEPRSMGLDRTEALLDELEEIAEVCRLEQAVQLVGQRRQL